MKMMKYMTSIATALFALVACSDADDILSAYHNDPNAVHINAEVGKASADGFTRSNPLGDAEAQKKFNDGDMISVTAGGQAAVTYRFDGSEWIPQDSKFLKWESDNMKFTAYYPAASYSGGTITQPTAYPDEASLIAADYMSFNDPINRPKDNNALTLTMERQMARVVVQIVGFNNQYDENTPINSVTINGVKAYKHSVDNKDKYYALMVPCSAQNNKAFLSLEVGTGNTETLTGIPELVAGKSYTYQLTVGKNKVVVNGITVKDWTTDKVINDVAKLDDRPYLTFTAAGAQKFMMKAQGGYTISGLEYSLNGGEWDEVKANTEIPFGGLNSTLRLRGTNPNGTAESFSNYSTITFTDASEVTCKGDIRTLLDYRNYATVATNQARFCKLFENCAALTSAPALPAETLADYCYSFMFEHCTSLKTAPNLPATKLARNCYFRMFNGCKSLETAPTLLAESLVTSCYGYMFMNCTNLKSAPQLCATALALNCYIGMFQGCTSLETAPTLPATTLAPQCYYMIFKGCTNLSSVTMLAPNDQIKKATDCCKYWLDGAGTGVRSHTLKVKDEDAYNALESNGYLPGDWKKPQCNVQDTPYLTFTAKGAQTFKMTVRGGYDLSGKFEYSVNGGEWNEVVADKEVPFGGTNGTLSLRGTNLSGTGESVAKYSKITFTDPSVKVTCTGDIRTLLKHADYKNVVTNQARFYSLFENCSALTSAPDLPAESIANYCYFSMFSGCNNLKSAPELPAKILKTGCYDKMFSGCVSLETAPTLPAETLAGFCYRSMFSGCKNLKSAPALRVEKLETACYNLMFDGCTNLSSVTMLAPSDQIKNASGCCTDWLKNAGTGAASRTLIVKDKDAYDALVNKSYLPARWKKDQCTVKNESGTPIK